MSNQFHNRLVGTIVVVALGVIFLPDILDGKKQRQEETFAEIPLRPTVEKQATPEEVFEIIPESSKDKAKNKSDEWVITTNENKAEEQVVAKKKATTDKSQSTPVTVAKSSPKEAASKSSNVKGAQKAQPKAKNQIAWTLQLGSFNHAGNVNALVKKLRKAGFRAYTLPSKPVNGKLTKVFVGPDISKEKIKKLRIDVEKITKLKGRMVPYNPLETSS